MKPFLDNVAKKIIASKSKMDQVKIIVPSIRAVTCLLYTSPSPRDATLSRMPSSA